MSLPFSDFKKPELTQADSELIVRELGGGRSPEEVCRMLCMQRGYEWLDAQSAIAQVAEQSRTRIARRQAPLLIFLGIVTLICGIVLVARTGYLALHFDQIRSLRTMIRLLPRFGLGVAMIGGSAAGLVKLVIDMWK